MKLNLNITQQAPSKSSIAHYSQRMPWQRVCTVKSDDDNFWFYQDIDETVMFSPHNSWVYAITVDGNIVKFGETGNPLGIRPRRKTMDPRDESQPIVSSQCRLGRSRKMDGSDQHTRDALQKYTSDPQHLVEIWAIQCGSLTGNVPFIDGDIAVESQFHKHLEKALLDDYFKNHLRYPLCNTGRC